MGNPQNGRNSTPVLIAFKEQLLKRASLVYMVHSVRPSESTTTAKDMAVWLLYCRGHHHCRCCGEDHDGRECNKPVKCSNLGGDHLASFRACPDFVKAEQVPKIRQENKISNAEAERRVEGLTSSGTSHTKSSGYSRQLGLPGTETATPEDSVVVSNKAFLAFVAEAMWKINMVATKSDADM